MQKATPWHSSGIHQGSGQGFCGRSDFSCLCSVEVPCQSMCHCRLLVGRPMPLSVQDAVQKDIGVPSMHDMKAASATHDGTGLHLFCSAAAVQQLGHQ